MGKILSFCRIDTAESISYGRQRADLISDQRLVGRAEEVECVQTSCTTTLHSSYMCPDMSAVQKHSQNQACGTC